ncbi:MAG: acyltransferase [Oscillospiraceae bacterium]|nr:acyltransferase [Oscillospiraceae bacterium]
MENKQRFDRIDIAKGIGIILVVFAHTIVPQIRSASAAAKFIWIFIYNFHMPLFFFLSGYLFEKGLEPYTDKGKFILGKLKYLMIPYITFSVFAYALVFFAMKSDALAEILKNGGYAAVPIKDAAFQILTYSNHTDQHLWFVFSLFIVFLLNILFPKIMKSKPMIVLLAALYVSKAYITYFGILNYTASDLLFFSLARAVYSKNPPQSLSPLKFLAVAVIFITSNCIYSYFYVTAMPSGAEKGILYLIRILASVTGIAVVCQIARFAENKKAAAPLKTLGLYSYDIYLMHAPFLVSGSMGMMLAYTNIPAPLCCAAALIIGVVLPYAVSKFIVRKIPALSLLLLGKNHKKSNARYFNV